MENLIINPGLLLRFDKGSWQFLVPEIGKTFEVDRDSVEFLNRFAAEPGERSTEMQAAYTDESAQEAAEALVEARVLIEAGTIHPLISAWDSWTPATWYMHLAGRNVRFATTDAEQDMVAQKIAETPPPDRYKCTCTKDAIKLPDPRPLNDVSVGEVLLNRRTCRLYDEEKPIALQDLSDVIYYSGGVVFEHDAGLFGTVLKKCSPSPGARHTIEMYPIVVRCEGAEPGTYHYCTKHHSINLISPGDKRDFLLSSMQVQPYFSSAAVACFFTTVTERMRWKYKGPRIYRLSHLEVAHYCQNFLLAGTAIGLGVFSTGAIEDFGVEKELRIDGVDEVVLYVAGMGHMRDEVPYYRDSEVSIVRVPADSEPRLPGRGEPQSEGS